MLSLSITEAGLAGKRGISTKHLRLPICLHANKEFRTSACIPGPCVSIQRAWLPATGSRMENLPPQRQRWLPHSCACREGRLRGSCTLHSCTQTITTWGPICRRSCIGSFPQALTPCRHFFAARCAVKICSGVCSWRELLQIIILSSISVDSAQFFILQARTGSLKQEF
jgi:hypothetical protein